MQLYFFFKLSTGVKSKVLALLTFFGFVISIAIFNHIHMPFSIQARNKKFEII